MSLEQKIESLQKQLDTLKQELNDSKTTPSSFPVKGDKYYLIDNDGEVLDGEFVDDCRFDKNRFNLGNLFKTEEEAEKVVEKLKLLQEIKIWRIKNDPDALKLDWKDEDQEKYCINKIHSSNKFTAYSLYSSQDLFQIYFSSEEVAEDCIEHFGERLNLLLLV